jgi:ketosteroid isomerase-like protein
MSLLAEVSVMLECSRQTGNTSQLIKMMYADENTVLVVGSGQRYYIVRDNRDLENRIITIHETDKIRGMRTKILFDHTAIAEFIYHAKMREELAYKRGKNEVQDKVRALINTI